MGPPSAPPAVHRHIVFDFGKVLFDWNPTALLARLLPARAGHAAAAEAFVAEFFQDFGGDWGEFDRGILAPEVLADRIAARTGLTAAEARSVIDAVPHELAPMAGMLPLLHRLREAGHRLYFLSNMPLPYADHLEATHDFLGLFDAGIFSGRVRLIKPDPAIFRHAAAHFGIPPAETLFIDDVAANVEAARAEGWQAIHFVTAVQCRAELARIGVIPGEEDRRPTP